MRYRYFPERSVGKKDEIVRRGDGIGIMCGELGRACAIWGLSKRWLTMSAGCVGHAAPGKSPTVQPSPPHRISGKATGGEMARNGIHDTLLSHWSDRDICKAMSQASSDHLNKFPALLSCCELAVMSLSPVTVLEHSRADQLLRTHSSPKRLTTFGPVIFRPTIN